MLAPQNVLCMINTWKAPSEYKEMTEEAYKCRQRKYLMLNQFLFLPSSDISEKHYF